MLLNSFIFKYYPPNAKALAVMVGSLSGTAVAGFISFQQNSVNDQLQVNVNISGLVPGQGTLKHGLHVHLNSIQSTSDNVTVRCGSTGPHFNPTNQTHGNISAAIRHVGDYGNAVSDNDGNLVFTFNDTVSNLYGPFGIVGRTIVLHQLEDDLGKGGNDGSLSTGKIFQVMLYTIEMYFETKKNKKAILVPGSLAA